MSSSDTRPGAPGWLHFAGVGGSGMSALACFHVMSGGRATGSDRAFDQGALPALRAMLERAGVEITPQDGSFLRRAQAGESCDGLVVSTAVEDKVPDVAHARAADVPVLHRSELLARHVAAHRTIAVSGTSGKSTVTAMIYAILQAAGRGPGLLTGGALADLAAQGRPGNVAAPAAAPDGPPWLVIEADESDGSLVRYRPWCGVVLNLGLDHKSMDEVLEMFRTFRGNVQGPLVVGADANLAELHPGALLFGIADGTGAAAESATGVWARDVALGPQGSRFVIDGVPFTLDHPGRHNVLNAAAAVAACRAAGVAPGDAAAALASFGGVARRFQSLGAAGGVEVIDDFAHNPDKILASLAAARARLGDDAGRRVIAVFQPHGFGPTRFLRAALVDAFAAGLRTGDVLLMPEIFFAGGTVTRDISSQDLVSDVAGRGRDARFAATRDQLPGMIAAEARPGDLVLVMGARDPSLTDFCREIKAALDQRRPADR